MSDKGMDILYYERAMSILDKIKAEPGLKREEILRKFTKWERGNISCAESGLFGDIIRRAGNSWLY